MKSLHNPLIDLRYWVLISLASIFGTNTGDLAVRWYKQGADAMGLPLFLGFKHMGPFPILVILLALVFIIEKFDSNKLELYFWSAIMLIRTAATNIADTVNDELHVAPEIAVAILVILLAIGALIWQRLRPKPIEGFFIPTTNTFYWGMMCVAGILGTLIGDELAHIFGLAMSSLVLSILMFGCIFFGYKRFLIFTALYWFGIAFARIAGTAVGDWLAKSVERGGAGLGLPLATLCSGIVFIAVAIWWKTKKSEVIQ